MERFELIKRNTEEIVTEEELKELLKKKSQPVAYVGHAPTGRLHIGHLMNILKIGDFINAGFKFKFLIADLHAYLDDKKSPFQLLEYRSKYMELIVRETLKAIGIDAKTIEFVLGSSFQLKREYWLNGLLAAGEVTFERCRRAASEVVRFGAHPKLGGFIYPIMQNLDVHFLGADVAYGGIDQRGIYMLGREIMPILGMKKPICVFTPLLPSVSGGKMSASEKHGKVDLLDEPDVIKKKISQAYCPAGEVKDNAVLMYARYVLFPILEQLKRGFVIKRPEKFGGTVSYKTYEELERDFVAQKLHPLDLKHGLAEELARILEPVRNRFKSEAGLLKKAYPNSLE
ncbi:tyrosine--tRNA ligase [Candidatus Woesearchaeota archaeon]|nr:tyrosine--tRNA ligase [Candidatus Woesearchaeota archaeon]